MRVVAIIIWVALSTIRMAHGQDSSAQMANRHSTVDSLAKSKNGRIDSSLAKKDSVLRKKGPNPRRATIYSAILPGAGQLYNKKYWKIPIVLAAVGVPAGLYFYNKNWYNKTRYALAVLANGSYFSKDSISRVDPRLIGFIFSDTPHNLNTLNPYGVSGLEKYRNYFRSNEDYSVLFFLLFYGLQIVDATVDAHLKLFDVDRDLSLHLGMPSYPSGNSYALSLFLDFHKRTQKLYNVN
ncbi:MAG TPA: DUF5683 domain-containing protein [Puia sp.]|nr:DUF5683 domain-containing protein [Puia sp.]